MSLVHFTTILVISSQILIEPSATPCAGAEEVPVLILVSSSPLNYDNRQAVRTTWGKHQPTYFVMGLNSHDIDEQLVSGHLLLFENVIYTNIIIRVCIFIWMNALNSGRTSPNWNNNSVLDSPVIKKGYISSRCDRMDLSINKKSWINEGKFSVCELSLRELHKWLNFFYLSTDWNTTNTKC